jgi:hypothetical protein
LGFVFPVSLRQTVLGSLPSTARRCAYSQVIQEHRKMIGLEPGKSTSKTQLQARIQQVHVLWLRNHLQLPPQVRCGLPRRSKRTSSTHFFLAIFDLLAHKKMSLKAGESIATWQIVAAIVLLYLAQLVLKAVYRITLHPLAKFPGPILAALTYKYEFYFDGIKGGQYINKVARLHQIYGTMIVPVA